MIKYRPNFPILFITKIANFKPSKNILLVPMFSTRVGGGGGGGRYGEAPPERGTLFTLEVYKRLGISRAGV